MGWCLTKIRLIRADVDAAALAAFGADDFAAGLGAHAGAEAELADALNQAAAFGVVSTHVTCFLIRN